MSVVSEFEKEIESASVPGESGAHAEKIKIIAFYRFIDLVDLPQHKAYFKDLCLKLGLYGTILLSKEGVNSTLCGRVSSIERFQAILARHPIFHGLEYKESACDQIVYRRMLVKIKKEIIPIGDETVQPARFTAPRVSPGELKQWLDEGRPVTLVDTRNRYEMEYGTFENALDLGLDHFREIPERLAAVSDEVKKGPVVMFCTGGIRCEKATVVAHQKGFQDVYQLEGGILKYFEECGGSHYLGDCFVFDYRVAVDSNLEPIEDNHLSQL